MTLVQGDFPYDSDLSQLKMQLYGCEQDFFCQIRIIFLSDTVTKPIFHAGTVVFSGDHGSKRHFLPQNRSLETDFTVANGMFHCRTVIHHLKNGFICNSCCSNRNRPDRCVIHGQFKGNFAVRMFRPAFLQMPGQAE